MATRSNPSTPVTFVTPGEIPPLSLTLALLHTKLNAQARHILAERTGRLAALGADPLSLPQWRIVRLLGLGIAATSTDVRKKAILDKGQFSRTLDSLVARGLIEAAVFPEDQRQWGLSLTEHGQAVYACLAPALGARQRHLTQAVSETEYKVLVGALEKLCVAADDTIDVASLDDETDPGAPLKRTNA